MRHQWAQKLPKNDKLHCHRQTQIQERLQVCDANGRRLQHRVCRRIIGGPHLSHWKVARNYIAKERNHPGFLTTCFKISTFDNANINMIS